MLRRWVARSFTLFSRLLYATTGGGSGCRFEPSCSQYGRVAVERFGVVRGSWLAFRRLLRCRPGMGWGSDPVPECEGALK